MQFLRRAFSFQSFPHQIQNQLNKALDDMSMSLCTLKDGMSYTKLLPAQGLTHKQLLDKIREYETLSESPSTFPNFHLL